LDNGGEVIKAHPNLLIVADMNNGYRGTQQLNQAFNDRFGIKMDFPYDRAIENVVVGNKALLTLADQLRAQYDVEEIATPISTRGLVSFIHNAKRFGIDFAITSYVNGFDKEERAGVRLACETHKFNIASELGLAVPRIETEIFNVENV
jgi:MoxR-like ATPase